MDEAHAADDARPRPRLLARRRQGQLPYPRRTLQPQAGRRALLHAPRAQEAARHHGRTGGAVRRYLDHKGAKVRHRFVKREICGIFRNEQTFVVIGFVDWEIIRTNGRL